MAARSAEMGGPLRADLSSVLPIDPEAPPPNFRVGYSLRMYDFAKGLAAGHDSMAATDGEVEDADFGDNKGGKKAPATLRPVWPLILSDFLTR